MQLTDTGRIEHNGYSILRTGGDDWVVMLKGRVIGYAPDLTGAEAIATKDREKILANIARTRPVVTDETETALD